MKDKKETKSMREERYACCCCFFNVKIIFTKSMLHHWIHPFDSIEQKHIPIVHLYRLIAEGFVGESIVKVDSFA